MPATAIKRLPYPRTVRGFTRKYSPCDEAREFLATQPSMAAAWDACPRSDWMLWVLEHIGYRDDRQLRLFAVWCARQGLHLLSDPRSVLAIDVAERFAEGQATREELSAAESAAWSAVESAESAAESAWSAAWSAVESAAESAAWSAESAAAWSAESAAESAAWSAEESAAWSAESAAAADQLRAMIINPWR